MPGHGYKADNQENYIVDRAFGKYHEQCADHHDGRKHEKKKYHFL
jgi:hypothetical protein